MTRVLTYMTWLVLAIAGVCCVAAFVQRSVQLHWMTMALSAVAAVLGAVAIHYEPR